MEKENSEHTNEAQTLGDGLVLRTAESEHDVARVAAFNGAIHGAGVDPFTRHLFLHHPHTHVEDLIFVEHEPSGQVVSSLCLIPWTWSYGGVRIPAGEMGIVGTREEYRRRGLIRAQVALFNRRLRQRGCLLSHIQGIPYYYRQFGYQYALPLEGGLRLELRHVPAPPDGSITFRPATPEDAPVLSRLYAAAAADLELHAVRDQAAWRYVLTRSADTEMEREIWILQDGVGELAGYVCAPKFHFGEELTVNEVSRLGFDGALATLHHLKTLARERDQPGLRLTLPAGCTLMRLARSLGAHDLGTYAWQIHLPDVAALLRALTPVLERRVAASAFAGLTRDVDLGLYRRTVRLRFRAGALTQVIDLGFTGGGPIQIPPPQFTPLVLGYRTREELRAAHPDLRVAPASRLLVDTLFPKMTAFLFTAY